MLMDVAVSDLRSHLSEWLERARDGEELVVTDRGTPIARVLGLESTSALERLTRDGLIGRPASPRRPIALDRIRARATRPVSDLVGEQRR